MVDRDRGSIPDGGMSWSPLDLSYNPQASIARVIITAFPYDLDLPHLTGSTAFPISHATSSVGLS